MAYTGSQWVAAPAKSPAAGPQINSSPREAVNPTSHLLEWLFLEFS